MKKFIYLILIAALGCTQSINTQISQQRKTIITETVQKVSPAVVGITVYQTQKYLDPFFDFWSDDPFFRHFFGDRSYRREVQSVGSGFIISDDGYILTNDHVAGKGDKIIVTLTNGETYKAKIIGTDYESDICILKIDASYKLPFLKFANNNDILIGEWVIALGNPFGLFNINDQPTVSVGVVSAKDLILDPTQGRYYTNMIQTDAAINGGNSGGPLVNALGEVLGMNTLIYSAGGSGNIGIGFAIPAYRLIQISNILKKGEKIDRNFWTGLSVQNIDDNLYETLKLKSRKGVIINNIAKNSPAEKAELQTGDIIIKLNNHKISNDKQLLSLLYEYQVNDVVTITVIRDAKEINLKMKLTKK